ncbi:MAG: GNAT family N-acetyltransferase, partial [Alphaproteobacteria bacterium]|nr:GNAT family N-acetyltransferase [Alphaproteobacteria bacterium]NDG37569.1 GNAT family N-acetyltransferase [Alphaproteobacteria bacterium]
MAELSDNICVRKAQETDLAAILRLLADDTLGRHREDAFVDQHGGLHDDYLNAFNAVNCDPNQYLA